MQSYKVKDRATPISQSNKIIPVNDDVESQDKDTLNKGNQSIIEIVKKNKAKVKIIRDSI